MLRSCLLAGLLLLSSAQSIAATLLEQKIDQLLRRTRAVEPGAVGIQVLQLATGKILYSREPDRLFIPASNVKLFTTALALTRLGPDYRMTTHVYAQHSPDASGRIHGNLIGWRRRSIHVVSSDSVRQGG